MKPTMLIILALAALSGCATDKTFRNLPSCTANDEMLGNSMYSFFGITSEFDKEQGRKFCEALRLKAIADEAARLKLIADAFKVQADRDKAIADAAAAAAVAATKNPPTGSGGKK